MENRILVFNVLVPFLVSIITSVAASLITHLVLDRSNTFFNKKKILEYAPTIYIHKYNHCALDKMKDQKYLVLVKTGQSGFKASFKEIDANYSLQVPVWCYKIENTMNHSIRISSILSNKTSFLGNSDWEPLSIPEKGTLFLFEHQCDFLITQFDIRVGDIQLEYTAEMEHLPPDGYISPKLKKKTKFTKKKKMLSKMEVRI